MRRINFLQLAILCLCFVAQARFRQPSDEYAARRAKLRAAVDGPIVIFGYTGHEDASEVAVFFQEPYFYYLTGHDEPGAVLLLIPDSANKSARSGAEIDGNGASRNSLSCRRAIQQEELGRAEDRPGRSGRRREDRFRERRADRQPEGRSRKARQDLQDFLHAAAAEGRRRLSAPDEFGRGDSRRDSACDAQGHHAAARRDAPGEVRRRAGADAEGH